MANTETLNLEVKSNIKSVTQDTDKMADSLQDVNQEAKEGIGNFTMMGVSLNGVKAAMGKIIPMAKTMFGTIKAGMISTGIGALVVAFGTLAAWFTKTKQGAEQLSVIFTAVGAAVSVIIDRVSKFGGGLAKILSGNITGGLTDMKNSFKAIGIEILIDTALAAALQQQLVTLTDAERELNVETAQRRAEIEQLKMIAEDLTKTEEERLDAAKKAFDIENNLLNQRVDLAEKAVDIQQSQNNLNESMAEDLDALAEKEIALANIQGESATKQIELNNKINAIEAEAKAKRQAAHTERLAQIAELEKAELDRISAVKKAQEDASVAEGNAFEARANRIGVLREENYLNEISDLQLRAEEKLRLEKENWEDSLELVQPRLEEELLIRESFRIKEEALRKQRDDREIADEQAVANAKARIRDANINNISAGISLVKSLAGENKGIMASAIIAENAMGIARTIISTQASNAAVAAEGAALAIPSLGASATAAIGLIASNNISMGISIAASVAATAKGLSALGAGGATGGGAGAGAGAPRASSAPPAPQMMSGSFELTGGVEPEPLQAYVVSDDITNSQNALEIIRRRATI